MKPSRTDEDAVVDLLDVLLRDGVVVEADVVVSVADIPLVGVKLRAAVAGMTTMTEYGMFESFDRAHRARGMEGDVLREPVSRVDGDVPDEEGSESTDREAGETTNREATETTDREVTETTNREAGETANPDGTRGTDAAEST